MKCTSVNWNIGTSGGENAKFTVCTSRFSPSLIHGLCAFFASNSRFMRPFQAALNTCLDSPFFCQPFSSRFALHGLRALEINSLKEGFGVEIIAKLIPQTILLCNVPFFSKSLHSLRAQRLKKINLDWNFQSRLKISILLEMFNPGPSEFPTKIGVWWVARLKISISIENFNPGGRSWIFSIFGPLGFLIRIPFFYVTVTVIFGNNSTDHFFR